MPNIFWQQIFFLLNPLSKGVGPLCITLQYSTVQFSHYQGVGLVRHLEVGRVEADREPFPVRSGHGDLGLAGPGVELTTDLREVAHCLEKAPTMAFSLLKVPTWAFTSKNLLRHYAKRVFKIETSRH